MNSRVIFIIAFIAIMTGLYGIYDLVNNNDPVAVENTPQQKDIHYFSLWKTTKNIHKGSKVTDAELVRVTLPEDEALALGISHDVELNRDSTTLFRGDIPEGKWVFPEMLATKGSPGYLHLITDTDMTLYPLSVSTRNLITDYIQPGDRIDVVAVSSPSANLAQSENLGLDSFSGVSADVLLSGVKVISIAQDNEYGIDPVVKASEGTMSTVVIEVNPDILPVLTLAQRTSYLEIYLNQPGRIHQGVDVSDVIKNYSGVLELRGSGHTHY
ncbi:Flp pilus assembly protein CpaB [Veronia pacifica]|uniref:Flp pilus assembly protein CpaB n=1 Tax=Veronia pacifica TaxID=1080227 RepID=A0A1C3ESD8_9GAMM|nr:Flp pilus assembly protein CpaB [Veronia pacifica]ODA36083.1 Flp pilus assembly protein CpaB [Veronia pacifica]